MSEYENRTPVQNYLILTQLKMFILIANQLKFLILMYRINVEILVGCFRLNAVKMLLRQESQKIYVYLNGKLKS